MKPIIFSTPMVQAILDGRKTQTRRVVKPQPTLGDDDHWHTLRRGHHYDVTAPSEDKRCDGTGVHPWSPTQFVKRCAPCQPGDVRWVRETWRPGVDGYSGQELTHYFYKADGGVGAISNDEYNPWRPSIHMPRAAARIFLRVTDVRAERVQEITREDTFAEGMTRQLATDMGLCVSVSEEEFNFGYDIHRVFVAYWNTLNAKRGFGWDSNPWVLVYTFERISEEEAQS